MHHAIPDGMDVRGAADLVHAGLIRCDVANQVVQGRSYIAQWRGELLLAAIALLKGDDGFPSSAFYHAAAQKLVLLLLDVLQVGRDDLKLQAGTSGIQDEYVHVMSPRGQYGIAG